MDAAQRRIVVTLGFCGLVSAADNWFVSPALPSIAHTLAVLPSAAAIILTAYLLPYGLLQPVCGAIGDAVGRLRLLRVIVMGLSASTVLCALAPTLPLLVTARIVTGCFAAGIISVSQALVGDTVGPRERSGAVGLLMGITFAGQGLSAGLGGIITDLVGWRAAFVCFGVLGLVAWAGLLRLRGIEGAGAAARRRGPVDTAGFAHAARTFCANATRLLFVRGRTVFSSALVTGILFLGAYGFMGTFLAECCGLTATQSGLLMMFYGVACLLGGSISGRIAKRRGRGGTILVGQACGLASCAALILSTVTASWIPALASAALLGMGYILVQPTLVSLSMEVDAEHAGLCTGLIGLGVFAGGGVGSTLGQFAVADGGYLALWGCIGVAMCLWLILANATSLGRRS